MIKGTHIYTQVNSSIPITVSVTGPSGSSASQQTAFASVSNMPSGIAGTAPAQGSPSQPDDVVVQASGTFTIDSYAGVGFQENEIATAALSVEGEADPTPGDLTAQVNWGDSGTWESADLVYTGTSGSFADYIIKGTHIYAQPGTSIPIVVYVNGPDGTSVSAETAFAKVSKMPSGIPGTAPAQGSASQPANVVVQASGTYTINSYAGVGFQENQIATAALSVDDKADSSLSDITAQVNWGDSATWNRPIWYIRAQAAALPITSSRARTSTPSPARTFPSSSMSTAPTAPASVPKPPLPPSPRRRSHPSRCSRLKRRSRTTRARA